MVKAGFLGAESVERIPGFLLIAHRVDDGGLTWSRGPSFWEVDDLVILDKRVGCLRAGLYGGGVPFNLRLELRPAEGERPERWPASLQADDWGYLGKGESFDGTLPASKRRTRSDFGPTPGAPGRPAAWLAALLAAAGERVQPFGEGDPDGLAFDVPREVGQLYRWSDGCVWSDLDVYAAGDLVELDDLPGIVIFATDIGGNGLAFDLNRATGTSCPVVNVDHETGQVSHDEAGTLRDFLKRALET